MSCRLALAVEVTVVNYLFFHYSCKPAQQFCSSLPACYTDEYTDADGRRVGEVGFIPPGLTASQALEEGCYTEQYRDAAHRAPGEPGFVPPLAAQSGRTAPDMAVALPQGFDANYRDARGNAPGSPHFVPPLRRPQLPGAETGLLVSPVAPEDPMMRPPSMALELQRTGSLTDFFFSPSELGGVDRL